MADPDFSQFKLVPKGHCFEEFHQARSSSIIGGAP